MEINLHACLIVLFIKNGLPYFPFVDPCYKTISFNYGPHKLTRRLHLCSFNAKAKSKMKGAETNLFTSFGPGKAGFFAQDTHLQTKPLEKHTEIPVSQKVFVFSSTNYIKRVSSEQYINSRICKITDLNSIHKENVLVKFRLTLIV